MLEKLLSKTLQALQNFLGLRLLLPISSSQVHKTSNPKHDPLNLELAVPQHLLVLKLQQLRLHNLLKVVHPLVFVQASLVKTLLLLLGPQVQEHRKLNPG
jgi:hypothetical protein